MARDFDPATSGYVQVNERLVEFREKHPEGCLRPVDPAKPYWLETIGDRVFVVYAAAAYRGPDDALPGIGIAWEPFPGTTPYTRNSELQNAETSAWGRAIVAVLAADTKRGIASADEIRNRDAERNQPPRQKASGSTPSAPPASRPAKKSLAEIAPPGVTVVDLPKGIKASDFVPCSACERETTALQFHRAKAKTGTGLCRTCEEAAA